MNSNEKHYIHTLFENKNFSEIYRIHAEVINEILSIDSPEDFEDFLENGNFIEETVFWFYYDALHGESLMIGGYEEDVTQKVTDFLKQQLPNNLFELIQKNLQNIYVDIDTEDNLREKIELCNRYLTDTGYFLKLDFDDTYYAGVYFVSVILL